VSAGPALVSAAVGTTIDTSDTRDAGLTITNCSLLIAAIRRSSDCLIAAALLVLLSPLLLVIGVAIWSDSQGQVIFRQRRLGRDRRPFVLYKFRTMLPNSDGGAHREYVTRLIAGHDEPQVNGGEKLYKPSMDARVTRLGRVLRRWSFDELPQLWNVIKGDMSLIGPRPVILYEVAHYPPEWGLRFAVKPGLTGLWQVSGRSKRTYLEMIEYDLEYVSRRSLRLDAVILARTIPVVLLRRGVC
jgi:lipopolysaccharide/colanic/teichoic acid biosynthesis glycosyltransferase